MAEYSIEVCSYCEAEVTGKLGTAIAKYRGHEYRVALGVEDITKDGYPCSVDMLPKAVYDFAARQYDALCEAYLSRSAGQ